MSGDLAFVGDVHLERDDPELEAFLAFLDRLCAGTRRIVLMGDLFNIWIGRRSVEQPHQRAVAAKLAELRAAGIHVRYVEGNRDYRIADAYCGSALDEAGDRGFSERWGGLRLFAIHGDLVNPRDRQYRTWRRLSRSAPLWGVFRALPRAAASRLADSLERRMRTTNLRHKRAFPEQHVRDYAARHLERHDGVVLGHFHEERELTARPPSAPGRIFVLPDWKSSRRYLRVTAGGEIGFVDAPG